MPHKRLPARLRLREREGREPRWVIIDGRTEIDTGCGPGDYKGAEEKLGEHIAASRQIDTSARNPAQISVADVIALYVKNNPAPPMCYHAAPLLAFFGLKTLRDINGQLCRKYAETRGAAVVPATVRRELVTLQAAINFWHVESPLDAVPKVWKPEDSAPRDRVLTRNEAARLLAAARRLRLPYVARFILLGLYTGTRHAAILALRWHESADAGWLDADRGIIHRAGKGEAQTRKRRGAARMPDRLLAHVRRWARMDLAQGPQMAVVRYRGHPITRQQRGWDAVVKAAGLGADVTPHVLKHSAATWLLRAGVDLWDVSALTSTSMKTLESVYGHHSPEFQQASAKAFRRKA
jgi:integrase